MTQESAASTTERPRNETHVIGNGTLKAVRRSLFLVSLPLSVLGFMLPVYGYEIGATAIQVGLFFSAFSLVQVLLRPLVGAGVDRYGRRPFFLAGLLGYALSMLAFAFADGAWGIVLARTLQGIAASFLWLTADAIVADVTGSEQRGRTFGRTSQVGTWSQLLGTFVGFNVLFSMGTENAWRPLFIGYGTAGLFAVFLAWRGLGETNPLTSDARQRPITWSRTWILLLLISLVTAASWSMISPIVLVFLQERLDMQPADLAYAYLPAAILYGLLPGCLGALADRLGRKPLMILGTTVGAVSSFLLPGLTSLWGLAALQAIQAICGAASGPARQALVAELIGTDQRGRAYGLYALAGGLGSVLGPVAGGWLYESLAPAAPFYANGITLAACTVVLWLYLQMPARQTGGQSVI